MVSNFKRSCSLSHFKEVRILFSFSLHIYANRKRNICFNKQVPRVVPFCGHGHFPELSTLVYTWTRNTGNDTQLGKKNTASKSICCSCSSTSKSCDIFIESLRSLVFVSHAFYFEFETKEQPNRNFFLVSDKKAIQFFSKSLISHTFLDGKKTC